MFHLKGLLVAHVYFDLLHNLELFKKAAYYRLQFDSFDSEYLCVTSSAVLMVEF